MSLYLSEFKNNGKDARRISAEVAPISKGLQIIDMDPKVSKLCFWKFVKKCQKYKQIGSILGPTSVDQTTRLRRVIGCLQTRWLGASKPLVLAGGAPSGGFCSAKKASKNQTMRIYQKKIHLCVFLRKLII